MNTRVVFHRSPLKISEMFWRASDKAENIANLTSARAVVLPRQAEQQPLMENIHAHQT